MFCTVITAQDKHNLTPTITLLSPESNLITTKSKVLFKGVVTNSDTLYLNDTEIALDKDGKFYYKANLTEKDTYNQSRRLFIRLKGSSLSYCRKYGTT